MRLFHIFRLLFTRPCEVQKSIIVNSTYLLCWTICQSRECLSSSIPPHSFKVNTLKEVYNNDAKKFSVQFPSPWIFGWINLLFWILKKYAWGETQDHGPGPHVTFKGILNLIREKRLNLSHSITNKVARLDIWFRLKTHFSFSIVSFNS